LGGKEIVRRFPPKVRNEFMLPLVVFTVQTKKLAALYAWVLEPFVEQGEATLRSPVEFGWNHLDDRAMDEILARVDAFWEALLKQVKT
jgi:hypothetical protein